ncbi:hypothetical protein MSPP1_003023 [Malassezia sp. CBS 17886]|nr:hypothetical protein MSPP1_003023 [Malassezia sp. CBS 17886]
MRSPSMRRKKRPLHDDDDDDEVSSPPGLPAEDEDELRADFFAHFDPQAFLAELDAFTANPPPLTDAGAASLLPPTQPHVPPPIPPVPAPPARSAPAPAPPAPAAPGAAPTPPSELYSTAIQILTHILGSSTPYPWLATDATPRPDREDAPRPPPWDTGPHALPPAPPPAAEPGAPQRPLAAAPDSDDLQHLINTLVVRLGGSAQPTQHRVREQDLTQLLQALMEQERQRPQPVAQPMPRAGIMDLNFSEDEDEDDPDFQPSAPRATHLPSQSAWSRAMEEMAPHTLSGDAHAVGEIPTNTLLGGDARFAVGPAPAPAGHTFSPASASRPRRAGDGPAYFPPLAGLSGPASPPPGAFPLSAASPAPAAGPPGASSAPAPLLRTRAGRTKIYTAEEAAERKRARNRQYAKQQRLKQKEQRIGVGAAPDTPATPSAGPPDELVLEAEVRFLRAEMERLREENAQLRGREQMRAYAARSGLDDAPRGRPHPRLHGTHDDSTAEARRLGGAGWTPYADAPWTQHILRDNHERS